ncbi:hypothetical protein IWQ60_012620, partial [Tieghemiomyces parasiticus]
ASAHLTALRFVAANWSPSTRLAVFKTFVLPTAEYGLPLVHLAVQAKLTTKKSLAPLHQLLNQGVSWTISTCCPAVAHVMTGLPRLPERLVHLQVGFYKQMSQTALDAPHHSIQAWAQRMPLKYQLPTLSALAMQAPPGPQNKLQLRDFHRSNFASKYGTLGARIF